MFEDKIVYQIYPKSFRDNNGDGIGDINGIIEKLPYLAELGVDYLWLSPINKSPQYDNGYDIADYYNIDPIFGSNEDYFQLIKEANSKGLKIMMDLVLNHVSSEHQWFQKALAGDEKYLDYFIWRDEPNEIKSFFTKPAWTYEPKVGKYYFHLFDKHQPDLNWENKEVREEIYKMVNYWIEMGVEGFRLDVIDLIGKEPDNYITSRGPKFYKYLKELHDTTFKDKILTVGECWNSSLEDSKKMCTNGLTQIFHFAHLITTNGEDKWEQKPVDFNEVCQVIKKWQKEYKGSQTQVMNNHDMPRLVSLWLDDDKHRYESATLLAMMFSFLKGTQYIYQGEEVGLVNDKKYNVNEYNDVETHNKYGEYKEQGKLSETEIMERIAKISRDNPRTPIPWTKDGGFTTGTPWLAYNKNYKQINVEADLNSEKSVYIFYKNIIKFKKSNKGLLGADLEDISYSNGIISIVKGKLKIYLNVTNETKTLGRVEGEIIFNNYKDFTGKLANYQGIVTIKN